MKKIFVLALFMFAFYTGKSQVLISLLLGDKLNTGNIEFGLDIGYNFSQLSNFESNRMLRKLNIGFYFDFLLKNQWYINTGVLVKSQVGLSNLNENDVLILNPDITYNTDGTYYQQIAYFHVPVAVKYRFKNHLYASLGPQFALRTKGTLVYEEEAKLTSTQIKYDNRDLFTRLEVAGIATFGYTLRQGEGMSIGLKYFYGLTNIFKDNYYASRNSSAYVYVLIPIGKVKVKKEPVGQLP